MFYPITFSKIPMCKYDFVSKYFVTINWIYISCKVTRKKKSAVNKWVTLTIGKMKRKSIKSSGSKACKTPLKFLTVKGKEVALQKVANKMVATYLVLLKVQYRSSHFWILWKTLPLDYRPKGKRMIFKI